MNLTARELYAELYDVAVPDWPGEVAFYQELAAQAKSAKQRVLEIACGTGRICLRLAQDGVEVTGLDLSPAMLAVARKKSAGIPNLRWVEADMRSFDLGEKFGLVLIPGHSFQNLVTPDDQVACLECIRQHLLPGGILVVHLDHQSYRWLAGLLSENKDRFEAGNDLTHPDTGQVFRPSHAWSFEPSTQTASLRMAWEQLDAQGDVLERWERGPIPLHCLFRFEMEHLLQRVGFAIQAVYGDFKENALMDESSEMVWLAKNPD